MQQPQVPSHAHSSDVAGQSNIQYFNDIPTGTHYRNGVTGLFNQDYLQLALERLIKAHQRHDTPSTLALLQLENFYEIKSWVGEAEANLLLGDIANHVRESLPDNALLCHLKHREFALLLGNESSLKAILLADHIRQNLPRRVSPFIPPQLTLRCAVGMAAIDSRTSSAEVMLARARHDLRLSHYRAQTNKLNRVSYSPLQADAILKRIRQALQHGQLQLQFQSMLNYHSEAYPLVELRLQLRDGDKCLSAAMFFETAIQNALGEQLDRWVIEQACLILQKSPSQSVLLINLSQNSIVSPNFFSWLQSLLDRTSINPTLLLLQISELDLLVAQHHMDYFCYKLDQLGIKLCISNFGCTDKPFQILSLVRAQMVKLDETLLENLLIEAEKQQCLATEVASLHQQGIKVCVGMVEKIALLPLLWKAKLDYVQGNCLQSPGDFLDTNFIEKFDLNMDC